MAPKHGACVERPPSVSAYILIYRPAPERGICAETPASLGDRARAQSSCLCGCATLTDRLPFGSGAPLGKEKGTFRCPLRCEQLSCRGSSVYLPTIWSTRVKVRLCPN